MFSSCLRPAGDQSVRPGVTFYVNGSAVARIDSWVAQNAEQIGFAERRIADLGTSGAVDFERLVVAVRELRKLRSL